MSDRKLAKAVQDLIKQIWRLHRSITKGLVTWLLRAALIVNGRARRQPAAGFVLPTTVLLILVVTLTAGALSYRAFNTSTRTIADTQNRVIYNAATPAADRARTKLEFLFDANKDSRYPGGVPSDGVLTSMLLNGSPIVSVKGSNAPGILTKAGGNNNGMGNTADPYTLPDETRVDVNGDNLPDNAWFYRADTDGDGNPDATVVYSVVLAIPPDLANQPGQNRLVALDDRQKADGEVIGGRRVSFTRSGPLSNASPNNGCVIQNNVGSGVENGWYPDASGNTSLLRKNFQVDAFVVPDSAARPGGGANFTTLELQQDRILERGNKWGAWFRNDLEIFPGPPFQWNGAMHTEGSLIMGNSSFSAYLISSPASCLFYQSASEISVTSIQQTTNPDGTVTPAFNGVIASGKLGDDSYGGSTLVYDFTPNPVGSGRALTAANDWAAGSSPFGISSDPVAIQVRDGRQSRGTQPTNPAPGVFNNTNNAFPNRFSARAERAPYVDDTYRADNRWGPKFRYNDQPADPPTNNYNQIPPNTKAGSIIPQLASGVNDDLIGDNPPAGQDSASVGLDGYWERRARNEGLRVLVGQRIELGNSFGWSPPIDRVSTRAIPPSLATNVDPYLTSNPDPSGFEGDGSLEFRLPLRNTNPPAWTTTANASLADPATSDNEGDPLYPPYAIANRQLTHEAIQRRTLRDNLASVQAAAVYHAAVSRDYPVACLASTSHPGTPHTLRQSVNFVPTYFVNSTPAGIAGTTGGLASQDDTILLSDFFLGRGTDGWEFEPPSGNQTQFETDIANADSPVRIALKNLAQFAGDYENDNTNGAFPPTQEPGIVHPYPEFTMWGNFSNLRRTIAQLDAGTTYASLSPADKTYLQTAACTLGMMAYNIDRVQRFDPRNPFNDNKARPTLSSNLMTSLADDIRLLMDGRVDEAANNFEVLPVSQLATYNYGNNTAPDAAFIRNNYNPRDYDNVPAEAYIGKLREYYTALPANVNNDAKLRMAELVFEYFQIRRDRTYGFRPSPATNTWNYNPYVTYFPGSTRMQLWSSACDPNMFALAGNGPNGLTTGLASADALIPAPSNVLGLALTNRRMWLSRLCGTVTPPAALREGPGDTGLPQRNNNPDGTADAAQLTFIPKVGTSSSPSGVTWSRSPASFRTNSTPANSPLANGAYAQNNQLPYLQATVAPKWPSLYYIFPEFDHGQLGGVLDRGAPGVTLEDIDHRQPNGLLTDRVTTLPILRAFQPWPEPYIIDIYVNQVNPNTDQRRYRDVTQGVGPAIFSVSDPVTGYDTYDTGPATPLTYPDPASGSTITHTYRFINPYPDDRPVSGVALRPRRLPAPFSNPVALQSNPEWELPVLQANPNVTGQNGQYTPPNRILAPQGAQFSGIGAAVPFLDRVIFSGREWMPVRVMDIDLGMLRRFRPRPAIQGVAPFASPQAYPTTSTSKRDVWLPVSGIVYAFREDAVREDAINRPAVGGTSPATAPNPLPRTNITSAGNLIAQTSGTPQDPPMLRAYPTSADPAINVKAVDGVPDPDRRPYGFRLRDGSQLRRHDDMGIPAQDNIRGLSFFTDDPVYIMGDFNLHQTGGEDDTGGTRLEEFLETLPAASGYNETQFYSDRRNRDSRFASSTTDRWRPSEILADAISVISDTICDGSTVDTFMTAGTGSGATIAAGTYSGRGLTDSGTTLPANLLPYSNRFGTAGVGIYNNPALGLFASGCSTNNRTTFLNQNRPNDSGELVNNWSWLRENPADLLSPIRVSRNGDGVMLEPPPPLPRPVASLQGFVPNDALPAPNGLGRTPPSTTEPAPTRPPISYTASPVNGGYYALNNGRPLQDARDTRVNTIIVSGLVPSRRNESYGGLHNFPRFLEDWTRLWFSGSFLQLSFSNYGTAPFDQQAWEPGSNPVSGNETIGYYSPPNRLWGYDVALQLAPAGPAAARFITPGRDRNEFYSEPPANDPYIANLCRAIPDNLFPDNRCPS